MNKKQKLILKQTCRCCRPLLALLLFSLFLNLCAVPAIAAGEDKPIKKLQPNQVQLYEDEYLELLMMVEKTVKMPLSEYNYLLELIRRADEKKKKDEEAYQKMLAMAASEKFSITEGRLDCVISGDKATVNGELTVNLHGEGWKEIPIYPLPGLEKITFDGKEALLTKTEDEGNYQQYMQTSVDEERYVINTDAKGIKRIAFTYHPNLNLRNDLNKFYGNIVLASNIRVSFNVDITLPKGAEPSTNLKDRMTVSKNGELFTASVDTDFTEPLLIDWFVPRAVSRESIKPEYSGNFLSFFDYDETDIRLVTLASIEIITVNPQFVEINLPEGFKYTDSESPVGVSVIPFDNNSKLKVVLDNSVNGFAQVLFRAEAKRTSERPLLNPPKLEGAFKQSGWIAVKSEGYALKAVDNGGMIPADSRLAPSELVNMIGGLPDLAYKFRGSGAAFKPAEISLTKIKTADSLPAYVKGIQYSAVYSTEGVVLTEAQAILVNNSNQFLKVNLPAGSEMQSAFVDNKPVRPVSGQDGAFLIPIKPKENSQDGRVDLNFVFKSDLPPISEKGTAHIILPEIDMPVNHLIFHLYLPEGYKYKDFEGSMKSGTGAFTSISKMRRSDVRSEEKVTAGIVAREALAPGDYGSGAPGSLPVKITVPKGGIKLDFFDLLVINERPVLSFDYKKK